MLLYHYTSLAHLPWIMDSGKLRGTDNPISGWPKDFVWATTDKNGDRTTDICRSGRSRTLLSTRVRITIDNDEIERSKFRSDWEEMVRENAWGDLEDRGGNAVSAIDVLKRSAKEAGQSTDVWWARKPDLPITNADGASNPSWIVRMDFKQWGTKWRQITDFELATLAEKNQKHRDFSVNSEYFRSMRYKSGGRLGYNLIRLAMTEVG